MSSAKKQRLMNHPDYFLAQMQPESPREFSAPFVRLVVPCAPKWECGHAILLSLQ